MQPRLPCLGISVSGRCTVEQQQREEQLMFGEGDGRCYVLDREAERRKTSPAFGVGDGLVGGGGGVAVKEGGATVLYEGPHVYLLEYNLSCPNQTQVGCV